MICQHRVYSLLCCPQVAPLPQLFQRMADQDDVSRLKNSYSNIDQSKMLINGVLWAVSKRAGGCEI